MAPILFRFGFFCDNIIFLFTKTLKVNTNTFGTIHELQAILGTGGLVTIGHLSSYITTSIIPNDWRFHTRAKVIIVVIILYFLGSITCGIIIHRIPGHLLIIATIWKKLFLARKFKVLKILKGILHALLQSFFVNRTLQKRGFSNRLRCRTSFIFCTLSIENLDKKLLGCGKKKVKWIFSDNSSFPSGIFHYAVNTHLSWKK